MIIFSSPNTMLRSKLLQRKCPAQRSIRVGVVFFDQPILIPVPDQNCVWGDICCYGHVCPSGAKCYFSKKGKCKFVGGMLCLLPSVAISHLGWNSQYAWCKAGHCEYGDLMSMDQTLFLTFPTLLARFAVSCCGVSMLWRTTSKGFLVIYFSQKFEYIVFNVISSFFNNISCRTASHSLELFYGHQTDEWTGGYSLRVIIEASVRHHYHLLTSVSELYLLRLTGEVNKDPKKVCLHVDLLEWFGFKDSQHRLSLSHLHPTFLNCASSRQWPPSLVTR